MSNDLKWKLQCHREKEGGGYTLINPNGVEAVTYIEKLEFELHDCFHRIEELQTALRQIAGNGNATGRNPQVMCNVARAALEGKKE